MATNCFGSYKAKVARVTRESVCGVPVIGAKSTVVTDGFIKITLSPQYEAGQEFIVKNAWGDFCINEADKPRLKSVDATIDFCQVDPDLVEIVTGARLLMESTSAVGFVLNEDDEADHFALEGWSKVPGTGGCSGGSDQWVYWLSPNLGDGSINGDIVLENGAVTFSMKAKSKAGVASQWTQAKPYATVFLPGSEVILAGDHLAVNVTTETPPTATCGAVALAAIP